jgi:MoxR-like ATPase
MIAERKDGAPPVPPALLDRDAALAWQRSIDDVFLPEAVRVLIARLVARAAPGDAAASAAVKAALRFGPSPRAAIWLARIARALAAIDGRGGAGFEDVAEAVPYVLGHRLILSYGARLDGVRAHDLALTLYREVERELLGALPEQRAHRGGARD